MFDVKDEKGNVTHWAAEAGSPSVLGLIGWRKTSVIATFDGRADYSLLFLNGPYCIAMNLAVTSETDARV
jgi:hypothetical protein